VSIGEHGNDPVKDQLVTKLRPDRFPGASGKMMAVVAFILGEHWTDPAISELVVTSDGFVLDLIEAAGLTEAEVREFGRLQRERIVRYGRRKG
jgi:hypothetical protein